MNNIMQKIINKQLSLYTNNPLKVCFSNKKYTITTQTQPTQIVKVYFSLKTGFKQIFKNYLRTNLVICLFLIKFSV